MSQCCAEAPIVLSIFPGIGILDRGFEEAGYCVVRGPDLLWGGDVRLFHPPPGRFEGVIGGPPCQEFSSFAPFLRAIGKKPKHGNLIPEFERIISEAQPEWFVMENVIRAPIPKVEGYGVDPSLIDNRWLGGEQRRVHRFSFGFRGEKRRLFYETEALESPRWHPRVLASGGGNHYPRFRSAEDLKRCHPRTQPHSTPWRGGKKYFEHAKRLQGLPQDFDLPGFTVEEKCRAIGNAVALPMARALAQAVKRATSEEVRC